MSKRPTAKSKPTPTPMTEAQQAAIRRLIAGELAFTEVRGNLRPSAETETGGSIRGVLSGAFNPLHDGHRGMAAVAERSLRCEIVYELCVNNVDKLALEFDELAKRISQFHNATITLTRAATFAEKSTLFPGCTFVVGADTIARVDQTRYYGSETLRDRSIATLRDQGCRFLVFGRAGVGGSFETLERLGLRADLRSLCDGVEEDAFRVDVSSTQLRSRNSE